MKQILATFGVVVVVKAGTRDLTARRVCVALGSAKTLRIAIKNGPVVLE